MAKKKQPWKIGDIFVVQTKDAKYAVGQIIGREAEALNSVTVALFRYHLETAELAPDCALEDSAAISTLFTTRDQLDKGEWRVVGSRTPSISEKLFPNEHTREKKWVGARVIGSGIVENLLNAYFALEAWDDFKDPMYLDKLLISPERKPANVLLKSQKSN